MRLASSWMVIASGIDHLADQLFLRLIRVHDPSGAGCGGGTRRSNVRARRRRSAPSLSVRRPRCLAGAGLAAGFGAIDRTARGRRRDGGSGAEPRPRRCRRRRQPARPRRRRRRAWSSRGARLRRFGFAETLAWLRVRPCAWLPLPDGGALPRPCGELRRPRARPARCLPCCCAAHGFGFGDLRSSSSRTLASASALARALRSSSVSVRSTTPEPRARSGGSRHAPAARLAAQRPGAAGCDARRWFWRRVRRRRCGACRFFSTTTCLVRPWLKLWRTVPCLDARLERQGLRADAQSLVARVFRINHSAVLILLRCARIRTASCR